MSFDAEIFSWRDPGAGPDDPHRNVMLAVVSQAVYDIEIPGMRGEILRWVFGEDFELICKLADIDPVTTRERIVRIGRPEKTEGPDRGGHGPSRDANLAGRLDAGMIAAPGAGTARPGARLQGRKTRRRVGGWNSRNAARK